MIKTTVVGSYPVPAWLRVSGTREGLRDAMLVVLKTQELAGIDVVADGELCRWDLNHPETNGMIDYFVRPLDGVQTELTFAQLQAWREKPEKSIGVCSLSLRYLRRDILRFDNLRPVTRAFDVMLYWKVIKIY